MDNNVENSELLEIANTRGWHQGDGIHYSHMLFNKNGRVYTAEFLITDDHKKKSRTLMETKISAFSEDKLMSKVMNYLGVCMMTFDQYTKVWEEPVKKITKPVKSRKELDSDNAKRLWDLISNHPDLEQYDMYAGGNAAYRRTSREVKKYGLHIMQNVVVKPNGLTNKSLGYTEYVMINGIFTEKMYDTINKEMSDLYSTDNGAEDILP